MITMVFVVDIKLMIFVPMVFVVDIKLMIFVPMVFVLSIQFMIFVEVRYKETLIINMELKLRLVVVTR